MKVEPYLMFEGRCEEALDFYRRALGAQVTMLMRYKDNPEPAAGQGCAEGAGPTPEMVMHAAFNVGETQLMASDGMGSGQLNFQGISLALSPANEAEAKRYFDALAEGGQVQMPLAKTFFSKAFGMVADRFGVSWMVVAPE
ncbi:MULTISPECIES: VOC family protein [unclassified Acidovorax]|uniref:VOC family protein n=1 Tax=unclassified Acidovorax TaxID=2684926 RepID=UPI001C47E143|nr:MULTISPECIES: VOC family protein [unclassified Acidovorax]MBV7431635.1 VOC family protein [Acidovorax sp. sif0732]MBV7452508.1 VOC family protein [Acidovorax sp. sif0715]